MNSLPPGETRDRFYAVYLSKCFPPLELGSKSPEINSFIFSRKCGGQHAYFRTLRAFYNWAFSPASGLGLRPEDKPILKAPRVSRRVMPAQTRETIEVLLCHADNVRDRALISVFIDSGRRLKEVSDIRRG